MPEPLTVTVAIGPFLITAKIHPYRRATRLDPPEPAEVEIIQTTEIVECSYVARGINCHEIKTVEVEVEEVLERLGCDEASLAQEILERMEGES